MSIRSRLEPVIAGAAFLSFLYLISLRNYLLFHSIAEAFSIVIAFCIFVLAWNSRRVLENSYLLFIGIAYLYVGGLDFVHTLAYTGMGVFPGETTDLATQLWISARYMESLSLLIAPFFVGRRLRVEGVLLGYLAASALLLLSIFHWRVFPACFVEGLGLTAFKKGSEYVISALLLGSAARLWRKRANFDSGVLRLLIASIAITVVSELAFTFYVHAYGFSNLVGHFLKVLSFYLIYKAIVETGLRKPYNLLFRELRLREEALRESEERYRTIFQNAGTATFIIDDNGAISLVNGEFEKLTGFPGSEVQGGRSWLEFVAPADLGAARNVVAAASTPRGGLPAAADLRMVNRRGEERAVHLQVSAIPGTSLSVASAMDITERRRAEEIIRRDKVTLETIVRQRTGELLEAHRRLEESKRLSAIGTLAATVAHELRNPLGVIRTAVLNIRRKSSEPALETHLANVEKKIAESDRIIGNLLRYSNIRQPERQETSLHRILLECLESTARRFPDKHPGVETEIGSIERTPFDLDAVQITEVFDNILNNAYQAVEDAGGRVEVNARLEDRGVRVDVIDNGAGIDEKTLEMVFEPFFTTRARGTGLGLSICRELVRLHGGEVHISSKPGAGTAVTVSLPGTRAGGTGAS